MCSVARSHLQGAVLCTRVQLEVMDADGRDDVTFPPGVTGAVGEDHLVVAFARPQQTQVLTRETPTFFVGFSFKHLNQLNWGMFLVGCLSCLINTTIFIL